MRKFWLGIILTILSAAIIVDVFDRPKEQDYMVVATNFPAYDFARAIVGEENIKMILPPGSDTHHFEPSPQDLAMIKNADLVVYNGGESEEWMKKLIQDKNEDRVIKMMRLVDVLDEAPVNNIVEPTEQEYDEHIWTSPVNAVKIVDEIARKASEIWPEKARDYLQNATDYNSKIIELDAELRDIITSAKRKILVFGDRFPFLYLAKEYGLDYQAAFPGCAEETEPDGKTISYLVDFVKEHSIPVILKIELSSGDIAETIAKETNTKVMTLNSMHSISNEDYKSDKTYVDIMHENEEVIREALK